LGALRRVFFFVFFVVRAEKFLAVEQNLHSATVPIKKWVRQKELLSLDCADFFLVGAQLPCRRT